MNDRYLKGVLTVIAFALCWIAVQLSIRDVRAEVVKVGTGSVAIASPLTTTAEGGKAVLVYCANCEEKKK